MHEKEIENAVFDISWPLSYCAYFSEENKRGASSASLAVTTFSPIDKNILTVLCVFHG